MIKQYIFAVSARRYEAEPFPSMMNKLVMVYTGGICTAENADEAVGKAMGLAKEKWRSEEGYFGYGITSVHETSEHSLWFAEQRGFIRPSVENEEEQHG